MQYLIKIVLSAILIVIISEVGKRYSMVAAILASLPLTSILALTWMYLDDQPVEQIILVSKDIFWMVIPSLVFFVCFPILLKMGVNFWLSLIGSSAIMVSCYFAVIAILKKINIIS